MPFQRRRPPDLSGDKKPKVRDRKPELHGVGEPVRMLNWKLDWRAYFLRFCEEHGGNPVEVRGRLVLPDGWSYSSTSYQGPEWEPPTDSRALCRLLISYWSERRGIVSDELKLLQTTRKSMVEQMLIRSAPLMKRRRVFDDATDKWRWQSEELNLDAIDERIAWLSADVEGCLAKLEELEHVQGTAGDRSDILTHEGAAEHPGASR